MSVERVFHCDAPDCNTSASDEYPHWLALLSKNGDPDLHFCNMDCVMKYAAANSEPPEVVA